MKPFSVLVVQRKSHVADMVAFSRSVFARILEPYDYLAGEGVLSYTMIDENIVDLGSLDKFDAIVFSKHTSEAAVNILEAAKNNGILTIYDLDDMLLFFPEYSEAGIDTDKKNRFMYLISNADIVSIATVRLKNEIDTHLKRSTEYVPNGFHVERHYRRHECHGDSVKLIYTNADQIKVESFKAGFFDAVNGFLEDNPEIMLDVFSDPNEDIKMFRRYNDLGSVPWFQHKEALATGCYDIGIVPLGAEDDPSSLLFNSCKSPIKYLEYGGLKIAGVYSNSPIYKDVIENGITGILVNNDVYEWRSALIELSKNAVLRKKIIENAFDDVKENHHVKKSAEVWLRLLRS